MLVLTRKLNEVICFPGLGITIRVLSSGSARGVRLGIDAPQDIPVHRQEVYEAIKRENRKANEVKPGDTRNMGQ